MKRYTIPTSVRRQLALWLLLLATFMHAQAQQEADDSTRFEVPLDTVALQRDAHDFGIMVADAVYEPGAALADSLANGLIRKGRDWSKWTPNPQRALWLALVIPGAGQMYNRKYWKLPLVYGGFMGCIYAMSWNNMMYKDYAQAYLDIMDDDPGTDSYNKFLHLGRQITEANMEQYKTIFKKRKDKYRRWRDLSFFCMVGVYALSVIDAYVDAELSVFDISKDLSMKVRPAVMSSSLSDNPLYASSVGVNCSINF